MYLSDLSSLGQVSKNSQLYTNASSLASKAMDVFTQ